MSNNGEKMAQKVVGRNVAVALGIICIILGGVLSGSIYNYTSIISSKDSQIGTLMNQSDRLKSNLEGNITYYSSQIASLQAKISDLQNQMVQKEKQIADLQNEVNGKNKAITEKNTEIADLRRQIANLQNQIEALQNQVTLLQNQLNTLKAPKLIVVELRVEDIRPWLQTPYLHVYGYICNVGTNTANESKLHIIAYQGDGVVAKETDILLGSIPGESQAYVDANIYYTGSPITKYEIALNWQGGQTRYTIANITSPSTTTAFITTTITSTITTTTITTTALTTTVPVTTTVTITSSTTVIIPTTTITTVTATTTTVTTTTITSTTVTTTTVTTTTATTTVAP